MESITKHVCAHIHKHESIQFGFLLDFSVDMISLEKGNFKPDFITESTIQKL